MKMLGVLVAELTGVFIMVSVDSHVSFWSWNGATTVALTVLAAYLVGAFKR